MNKISYFILASYGITLLSWTWRSIATSVIWRNTILYSVPLWIGLIWVFCMNRDRAESIILAILAILAASCWVGLAVMIFTAMAFNIRYDISFTLFGSKLPFIPSYLGFIATTALASAFLLNSFGSVISSRKRRGKYDYILEFIEPVIALSWIFQVFKFVSGLVTIGDPLSTIPWFTSWMFIIPAYLPAKDYLNARILTATRKRVLTLIFGGGGFSIFALLSWISGFPRSHPLLWVAFIGYFLVAFGAVIGRYFSKPVYYVIDTRRAIWFTAGLVCLTIWTILNWFTVAAVYVG